MSIWPLKSSNSSRIPTAATISSGMLVMIAVFAVGVGGLTWYTLGELRMQIRAQRISEMTKGIEFIASQTEQSLQDQDLPRLRRLLLDAQATGLYHRLSIQYGNNQVLVTTDIGETYRDSMPESWGEPAVQFVRRSSFDPTIQQLTLHEPIQIAQDDTADLVAESMPIPQLGMLWRFELASMITGFSGLLIGAIAWLQMRQRPAPMMAVRSALSNYAAGMTSTQSLLVASDLGPETRAFNDLLEERDALSSRLAIMDSEQAMCSVAGDSFGLSSVCASLSQGMIVLDTNLGIQFLNGSGAAYLNADHSTSVGKQLSMIDLESVFVPSVTQTLSPDAPRRKVFEVTLEACQTTLRVTCTRVSRDQDILCLVFLEDITQQRHADESLNSFIAQTTHELRTPLTNIRLFAEEAIDAGSADEEFRSNAFNMINSESRRLERLVSDILCVSELEAGSMQIRRDTVRPEAMFEEMERDYAPQAESKEIKLVFDLPPKFPTLEADRDRLGQAIHNLIGNALKYTPSKGTVTVKAEFDPSDAMTVRVSDTGIGISLEDQSRIFERFCRAQDKRIESISGTGLGLAITNEIVKMHSGSLTVESELDMGSTFILTVPSGRNQASKAA